MLRHGLTVRETAERLGVSTRRVRALAKSKQLSTEYSGPLVLLDPAEVERLAQTERLAHRTLEPANAWALLALASGDLSLVHSLTSVSPSALSRLRARLRHAPLLDLVPLLRKRAEVRWLHADDDDVELILAEHGVVTTGVSVADAYNFDIAAPHTAEFYATSETATRLTRTYALEPNARANVVLHLVQTVWPFAADVARAPALVAAVDLADSPDQRTARAGREYLASHNG
jgi:excisionase family DNA binding protein